MKKQNKIEEVILKMLDIRWIQNTVKIIILAAPFISWVLCGVILDKIIK